MQRVILFFAFGCLAGLTFGQDCPDGKCPIRSVLVKPVQSVISPVKSACGCAKSAVQQSACRGRKVAGRVRCGLKRVVCGK